MVSDLKSVNVPLSTGHLQAMGRVCALWAMAENVLQHLLWAMIPTTIGHGKALSTHMSNESIVNSIKTLAQQRNAPQDTLKEMEDVLKELDELRILRNQIVHNIWGGR